MDEICVGKLFDSSFEAEEFIGEYCKANYHPVRLRRIVKTTTYNTKVAEKNQIPDYVDYLKLLWECKHFGDQRRKYNERKKFQAMLARGCKFQIAVVYNRHLQKFVVSKAQLEHINHQISPELYLLYSDPKKLKAEFQEESDYESSLGNLKNLSSKKRKLLESSEPIVVSVNEISNQPGVIYKMLSGTNNTFEVLFLQTTKQQKIFSDYKEVVQMDSSYKTNNLHYSLYTLLVEDKNGLAQPIAFGVLAKKDKNHIEKFLKVFMDQNDVDGIQCFVIDKVQAEMNAIKNILPDVHIIIYYFHVIKAAEHYLTNIQKETNKKDCLFQFSLALKSRTSEEFDGRMLDIKSISTDFYAYLVQNWIPFKQNITQFGSLDLMHLQNQATNRIKQFHSTLKKVMGSANLPINLKNLLKVVDTMSLKSLQLQFNNNVKTIVVQPYIGEYYVNYTDYAAGLISKEFDKMNAKQYSIFSISDDIWTVTNEIKSYTVEGMKCSCGMPTHMGFPCRHLLAVWNDEGETLFQPDSVAIRWKRDYGSNISNDYSTIASPSRFVTSDIPSSDDLSNLLFKSEALTKPKFKISNFSNGGASYDVTPVTRPSSGGVTKAHFSVPNKTKNRQFKRAMEVLKDFASVISDQPPFLFDATMSAFDNFKTLAMQNDSNMLNDLNIGLKQCIEKVPKLEDDYSMD